MPSPVENNITQPDAVRGALRRVFNRISTHGAPIALLVPDPVVRVFILPFENLPRRADEALPLLRWRLKKSVPFDVDETVVSWMRQAAATAISKSSPPSRASASFASTKKSSSPLGASLGVRAEFDAGRFAASRRARRHLAGAPVGQKPYDAPSFAARICASIGRRICLPMRLSSIRRLMLDEVFPAIAYYQDNWDGPVDRVRFSGFGTREQFFQTALASELKVAVGSMGEAEAAQGLSEPAQDLIRHGLDALAGWMLNAGS